MKLSEQQAKLVKQIKSGDPVVAVINATTWERITGFNFRTIDSLKMKGIIKTECKRRKENWYFKDIHATLVEQEGDKMKSENHMVNPSTIPSSYTDDQEMQFRKDAEKLALLDAVQIIADNYTLSDDFDTALYAILKSKHLGEGSEMVNLWVDQLYSSFMVMAEPYITNKIESLKDE